jgi:hypothetical protein
MAKHHYVYRSYEEGGREYIGRRTCNCLPEEDTKYFGSFYDKTFSPTKKIILFVCETPEEIAEIEIELHDFFDVAVNPQFANRAKAKSTGFDRTGVPWAEETKKKMSVARSGENNPMFGVSGENAPNYGNTGALSPRSKAIIAIKPDGTESHFGGVREAARELGIPESNLRYFFKNGKQPKKGKCEGWRFFYKNSEVLA